MKKAIRKEFPDDHANPEDLTGPDEPLKRLAGAIVRRALRPK